MSRVAVALSGGVDSAVAAALLVEGGYEVVGFTLKVWDRSRCCSLDDVEDARRVAGRLGIPFYVLEAHDVFEVEVVRPFVEAYQDGLTPNPCVLCNQRVKFRWLLDRVLSLGCEALATGHYARIEGAPGKRRLRKGVDDAKDQSYFLVPEEPAGLDRVWFPLGESTKGEVRRLAQERNLPVARKGESQDVCFVADGDTAGFLDARSCGRGAGEIVDEAGRVLGRHRGVHAYTVGQRKGLGLASHQPLYVMRRDGEENRLVVAPREALFVKQFRVRNPVWLVAQPPLPVSCSVKIRSTARDVDCVVEGAGQGLRVHCAVPQFAVAPGQLAVFYDGDLVLGSAWIENTERP